MPALNLSRSISAAEADPDFDVSAENDDEQERKARRRSRMIENQIVNLNSPMTNRSQAQQRQQELFTGMNNAQVAEHYSNCIKLAAENKITAKNAFNLHLIDYMTHMLNQDEIQNFQVASSSLDAGAKIYAGRVDAVHQDTYKVLTGLGRTDKPGRGGEEGGAVGEGAAHGAGEGDGDSDDDEAGVGAAARKKREAREKKRKNVILKALNKIRLKAVNMQFDMDPLFQQQAAAYDEGGTGELRLNHIDVLNDTSELLLDSNTQIVGRQKSQQDGEAAAAAAAAVDQLVDIANFQDGFSLLMSRGESAVALGRTFINFKFMGWDREVDDIGDSLMRSNNQTQLAEAFDLTNINQSPLDNGDMADIDIPADDDSFHSAGGGDDFGPPGAPLDDDDPANTTVYIGESKSAIVDEGLQLSGSRIDGDTFVTCLRDMLTRQLDAYGEFNDNLLGMWAGPAHWKKKGRFAQAVSNVKAAALQKMAEEGHQSPTSTNTKSTGKRKTRLKADVTINYDDIATPAANKSAKYTRVVAHNWGNTFRASKKVATTLSDPTLHKNMKKKYLLQQSNPTHRESVFRLMTREIALRTDKGKLLMKTENNEAQLDEVQLGEYNFNNANDVSEFCPLTQETEAAEGEHADGINYLDVAYDDDDDDVENYDPGNPFEAAGGFPAPYGAEGEGDQKPLDLIAEPRKIAKIDIGYAKAAKRINVKQLKRAMWIYLTNDENQPPIVHNVMAAAATSQSQSLSQSSLSVADETTLTGGGRPSMGVSSVMEDKCLSGLVREVPRRVPRQTAADLSVPIILTCLLYLANEKDIFLDSTEDLNDIKISQFLVEDQVNLLTAYKQQSSKKKRVNARNSAANKTQQRLDAWLDGDEDNHNNESEDDSS